MDINSFIIGFKKGKASGGGSDFPVKEFFEKTAEELNLKNVEVLKTYSIYTFLALKRLTIPDVKTIESSAIYMATGLTSMVLPKSLKTMQGNAFFSCTKLESVTFEGTPESVAAGSFSMCSKLKTINVPWSEGEVAGAPWGATSAQINYNYTGG